jgi:hypothetical protein
LWGGGWREGKGPDSTVWSSWVRRVAGIVDMVKSFQEKRHAQTENAGRYLQVGGGREGGGRGGEQGSEDGSTGNV